MTALKYAQIHGAKDAEAIIVNALAEAKAKKKNNYNL